MPSDLDRLHRVHDRAKELSRLTDFRRAVADAYPLFVQAVADYERAAAAAVEKCVAAARAALADGRVRTTYNGEPLAHLYICGSASPKPLPASVTEKRLAAAVLAALDAGYDGWVEHDKEPGVWRIRIELRKPIPFESGLLVSCARPKLPTLIDPRHARSVDALLWMHEHAPDVYRLVALYHIGGLADLHSVNPIVPKPSHTGVPTNESVMADVYWKARFPTTGPNRATSGLEPAVMPADAAEMLLRVVEQVTLCDAPAREKPREPKGEDAAPKGDSKPPRPRTGPTTSDLARLAEFSEDTVCRYRKEARIDVDPCDRDYRHSDEDIRRMIAAAHASTRHTRHKAVEKWTSYLRNSAATLPQLRNSAATAD